MNGHNCARLILARDDVRWCLDGVRSSFAAWERGSGGSAAGMHLELAGLAYQSALRTLLTECGLEGFDGA